jgi:putative ABC transport system substrate-binding protein
MTSRRQFMSLLGGAAAVWPLAARAQQLKQVRRIGVLANQTPDDPVVLRRFSAFTHELQRLGWTAGENVRIEKRWSEGDAQRMRRYSTELAALAPDVLLTAGSTHVAALQEATRTIPIMFVQATDPVGAGLVASLARPGGNTTGFTQFEYGMSAKWLELLKDVSPRVRRVAVVRNPAAPGGTGQFGAIQSVAPSFGVELTAVDVRKAGEIEGAIAAFAHDANSSMIVTSNSLAGVHRDLLIALAAKYKLPAVYFGSAFVASGGLMSYGPDIDDQYRRAAAYVDRILKGEKASDLPVQAPTKYELAINLKTAKTLGLEVPPMLLARANEVIE